LVGGEQPSSPSPSRYPFPDTFLCTPPQETVKGKDDIKKEVPPPKLVSKTILVERQLDSWDPLVTIRMESIDFRTDGKMRWNFTFLNQSGNVQSCWIAPSGVSTVGGMGSYVTDQDHKRWDARGHSLGEWRRFNLPTGEKMDFWIDFQLPHPDAKKFIAQFEKDPIYGHGLPTIVVELSSEDINKPSGTVKATKLVSKTILVERQLDSWDPLVTLRLESIDFRTDGKMRWNFAFLNQSGKVQSCWIAPSGVSTVGGIGSFVTDQDHKRWDARGHSLGESTRFNLPNEEKVAYWMDFQIPQSDAKKLTAQFEKDPIYGHGLPTIVVELASESETGKDKDTNRKATAGNDKEKDKEVNGTIVLRSEVKLNKEVKAFIEVDGKREMDWPNEKLEITLSVSPGMHRVIVRSKLGKDYFKAEFPVTVKPGEEVMLPIKGVVADPDGAAKWK